MKYRDLFNYVLMDCRRQIFRMLLAAASISIGVMLLTLFLSLGRGLSLWLLDDRIVYDKTIVEIAPKTMSLGMFQLKRPGLLGASGIDDNKIDNLKRLLHVQAVYPQAIVRIPLGAKGGGSIFGKDMYTDLIAQAQDDDFLKQYVQNDQNKDWQHHNIVPLVIHEQLIQVYNHSIAEVLKTPQLNKDALIGFSFDLVIGQSYMFGRLDSHKVETRKAQIVGFSPYAMKLGVTIPMSFAKKLEKEFLRHPQSTQYSSVFIKIDAVTHLPEVLQQVEKMGFVVSPQHQQLSQAITTVTLILNVIALIILAMASIIIGYIFVSQLAERRIELALMRALGASKKIILKILLFQVILIGLGGATLGLMMYGLVSYVCEYFLLQMLQSLSILPQHMFALDIKIAAMVIVLAFICAVSSSLFPILRAIQKPPAADLAVT